MKNIKKISDDCNLEDMIKIRGKLYSIFVWQFTEQGHQYWENVYNNLDGLIRDIENYRRNLKEE